MVSAMPRSVHPVARWLPIVGWLDRYRRDDLGGDLVAGLTVAAILLAWRFRVITRRPVRPL